MISSLLDLGQLLLPIIPCNLPSLRTSGGIGGSFSILLLTTERISFHMQTTHFGCRQCISLLVFMLFALFLFILQYTKRFKGISYSNN